MIRRLIRRSQKGVNAIENHMKSTVLIDTGTHRVELIEDGTDPKCNWVAIYKMDQNGEVSGCMRIHGADAEPYMRMAAALPPKPKTLIETTDQIERDYKHYIRKYTYYIKAGLNMKAEYYRGRCDAVIECLKRLDPERAGVLEERKLSAYLD